MKGRYRVGGVVEVFTCDDERYDGRRVDGDSLVLTADRVVAVHDGWEVRGGVLGGELLWVRDGTEHRARAVAFTGTSPAYDVGLARRLRLGAGERARVRLVELTEPVGAARTVEQEWARGADPEEGVARYDVADLATGETWVVHLADGVLVSREGARTAWLEALTH
ncbi:MAG: hypothetical protein ACXVGH_05865 [Mycobacteriales bacterium]